MNATFRHKMQLTPWGKAIIAGWLLILSFAVLSEFGPGLEVTLAPPTSKIEIASIEKTDGGSLVRFTYRKYRGVCALVSFDWFLRGGDHLSPVRNSKADGTTVTSNPRGRFFSSEWFVEASPNDVLNHSEAWWTHHCHWPPSWVLRRRVYP